MGAGTKMGHYTLCDLTADITQNSAEAGAALVELEIRETAGEFRFMVRDNGRGMTAEELARAKDPFVTDGIKHPRRRVGLGIPFLIQTAEQSGGGSVIESRRGEGTVVRAWFDLHGIDTPPVGDVPSLVRSVLLFSGPAEVAIRRTREAGNLDYAVRKTEITDALGELESAESLALLGKYLRAMEETEDDA